MTADRPIFVVFISRSSEAEQLEQQFPGMDFVYASFSDACPEAVTIRSDDGDQELIRTFQRLHQVRPFAGILNRKEKCVIPAARLAIALHLRPILMDPLLARDKYQMRQALNRGQAWPRTFLIQGVHDLLRIPEDVFPCVLKPRFGFNSRSVYRAHTRIDLQTVYQEQFGTYNALQRQDGTNSDFVVEDEIPGSEHTIDSLVQDGKAILHLISDKLPMRAPWYIEVGDDMPSRLPPALQQECQRAAERAIQNLGILNGWTHTEVRLHNGIAVPIECAARMGGGYFEQLYRTVFGIDRLQWLMHLQLGQLLPACPPPRCHAAARRVVVYGPRRRFHLLNPELLDSDPEVELLWPAATAGISRVLEGPPGEFNNTLLEFMATGASAAEAHAAAERILQAVRIEETNE